MPDEMFPVGYIKKQVLEPVGFSVPSAIPGEVVPPAIPGVAMEVKKPSVLPWVIAGGATLFAIIAIAMLKGGGK